LGTAAQGPVFCGPPTASCDIQHAGASSMKCASADDGANTPRAPKANTGESTLKIRLFLTPNERI
jgi:hypothetical protein